MELGDLDINETLLKPLQNLLDQSKAPRSASTYVYTHASVALNSTTLYVQENTDGCRRPGCRKLRRRAACCSSMGVHSRADQKTSRLGYSRKTSPLTEVNRGLTLSIL